MLKIHRINDFANRCGYFYNACIEENVVCNNGYNCKHPEQSYKEFGIGCCYTWSCPFGFEAEKEDFENENIDNNGYEYDESQFLVIEEEEE